MNESSVFHYLILAWLALAGVIFITLFFRVAPYGRHAARRWGPSIKSRAGWILMESTAPLVFAACFVIGQNRTSVPGLALLVLWETHYIHRAFIYPLHRRDGNKPMPIAVVTLGLVFNAVNGYLNGRYMFTLSSGYPNSWLNDPRFISGVILFIAGFIINRESDLALHRLRRPGESTYGVANSGFHRWVSCPNYLGEIIIWSGWALASWSMAGLSFAVWTAANLVPRARAHHLWYRSNFPDYPASRKTLIPGIW
jgi:3-oxo-5-alpha-steroid 4-dehydrogenase 1